MGVNFSQKPPPYKFFSILAEALKDAINKKAILDVLPVLIRWGG
jgi:hypothetical protein